MERIVVTGIGIVGPGGFGPETVVCAFPAPLPTACGYQVRELALEDYLHEGRRFRRVSVSTKLALAAMGLAVADAGFAAEHFGGEVAGLVVTITHGGAPYSVLFHRQMLQEGRLAASPLHFSESVPNAVAGNGAIALGVRGPVHTLIGEEPVGVQAIDLAVRLLRSGLVARCLVVGTEEWSEVIAQAYAQIDRARRDGHAVGAVPPFGEAAAALLVELESTARARGARPHAVLVGWSTARRAAGSMEEVVVDVIRDAFGPTGYQPGEADHILPPTGRHWQAAMRGYATACAEAVGSPTWVDLAPAVGNPAGASNVLQVAASAALIGAGKAAGPGLVVSTGTTGTTSAVVLARADRVSA
jgi:3-oxoacyl-[acyl-carrier-protein] synthase II